MSPYHPIRGTYRQPVFLIPKEKELLEFFSLYHGLFGVECPRCPGVTQILLLTIV